MHLFEQSIPNSERGLRCKTNSRYILVRMEDGQKNLLLGISPWKYSLARWPRRPAWQTEHCKPTGYLQNNQALNRYIPTLCPPNFNIHVTRELLVSDDRCPASESSGPFRPEFSEPNLFESWTQGCIILMPSSVLVISHIVLPPRSPLSHLIVPVPQVTLVFNVFVLLE